MWTVKLYKHFSSQTNMLFSGSRKGRGWGRKVTKRGGAQGCEDLLEIFTLPQTISHLFKLIYRYFNHYGVLPSNHFWSRHQFFGFTHYFNTTPDLHVQRAKTVSHIHSVQYQLVCNVTVSTMKYVNSEIK